VVFRGSRYANEEVIAPLAIDGVRRRVLAARRVPDTPALFEHIVADGERLDHLAHRFYRDSTKYWLILDANPEELNPFHLLLQGRRARIPGNRL
jgi:hypothetical protein